MVALVAKNNWSGTLSVASETISVELTPEYTPVYYYEDGVPSAGLDLGCPKVALLDCPESIVEGGYVDYKFTWDISCGAPFYDSRRIIGFQVKDGDGNRVYPENIEILSQMSSETMLNCIGLGTPSRHELSMASYKHTTIQSDGGSETILRVWFPNDAIPKDDMNIRLEIVEALHYYFEYENHWNNPTYESHANYNNLNIPTPAVTVRDNDQWEISASIYKDPNSTRDYSKALEPCPWIPVDDRYGAYRISREAVEGKIATDRSYDINVEFVMSGTATPGNDHFANDYYLTKNPSGSPPGNIIVHSSSQGGITIYTGMITIPKNENEVIVYVMPNLRELNRGRVPGADVLFQQLQQFFTLHRRRNSSNGNGHGEPTEKEVLRDTRALLHGTKDGTVSLKHESPTTSGGVHEVIDNVHRPGNRE